MFPVDALIHPKTQINYVYYPCFMKCSCAFYFAFNFPIGFHILWRAPLKISTPLRIDIIYPITIIPTRQLSTNILNN